MAMPDSQIGRCSSCGIYFREQARCPRDGTPLLPSEGTVDRYRILDYLGDGSMGVVYRAQHLLLENRLVALKLLHRDLAEIPRAVDRFFREAKAASQLENGHIVEVMDFGRAKDGENFLVMELLDGPSLREVLTEESTLPLGRAADLTLQIADGLQAAHRRGTVHRDLKPENVVLLAREGRDWVKLLDFGIAQLSEFRETRLTQAGVILGTPAYMSPEQASGDPVDHRTDIYALGAILYEMLTGRCPYEGESAREVLVRKLTRDFPAPRQLRPDLPLAIEAVLLHALDRKPQNRPASVLELADELRDAMLSAPESSLYSPAPLVLAAPIIEPSLEEPTFEGPRPLPRGARSTRPRPTSTGQKLLASLGRLGGVALDLVDSVAQRFGRPPRGARPAGDRRPEGTAPSRSRRLLPAVGAVTGLALGVVLTLLFTQRGGPSLELAAPGQGIRAGSSTAHRAGERRGDDARSAPMAGRAEPQRAATELPEDRREERAGAGADDLDADEHHPMRGGHRRRAVAPGTRSSPHAAALGRWAARIASQPTGADVYDGAEARLGRTPLQVSTARARTVTVFKAEYKPKTVQLPEHSTRTITVQLERKTMTWEVMSLTQLKQMLDRGEISEFSYRRRKKELEHKRQEKLVEARVKLKTGEYTQGQYDRVVKSINKDYR